MAKPSWFNDNQFRDYPFLTRVYPLSATTGLSGSLFALPHTAILDFCAIMEIDADYDERDGHYVYLYSVSKFGTVLTFKFRTTATEAANHEIVTHRDTTDPEFKISRDEASSIAAEPVEDLVCALQPRWTATVVTGRLDDVAALLTNGQTITMPSLLWQIEPSRIQSLKKSYLRAISLANTPRLHVTPAEGCPEESVSSEAVNAVIPYKFCMHGDLSFLEGFNCAIRQDNNNNAIIIGAGIGVGAGEPCEEVKLHDTETAPDGSKFLSGGPACDEVVKSINGVSGDDVTLIPGPGFRIQPDTTNPNKLIVNRALDDFALCVGAGDDQFSSLSAGDGNDDLPCDGLTMFDQFQVELSGGLLDVKTLICNYDVVMSTAGHPSWVSAWQLENYWKDGAFCGFRWRVKVVCEETVLRCSVVAYPLADNNACKTCTITTPRPVSMMVNVTGSTTTYDNTKDCPCILTESLATRVRFFKLIPI